MSDPEYAWACIAPDFASPPNFINSGTVRPTRVEAQEQVGCAWAREGETARQGWKRAYRRGWRCRRVVIRAWGGEDE